MEINDSIEQLKSDLINEQPDAVLAAVDAKAEEFLAACVKYAKTMQLSNDYYRAIRVLAEMAQWVGKAQQQIDKERAAERKPRTTTTAFRR